METVQYLRAIAALAFVVALMIGLLWVLRRYGFGGALSKMGAQRRLSIVESLAVDGRHRLILIRRDDTEHLLLVGAQTEIVIERNCRPATEKESC